MRTLVKDCGFSRKFGRLIDMSDYQYPGSFVPVYNTNLKFSLVNVRKCLAQFRNGILI